MSFSACPALYHLGAINRTKGKPPDPWEAQLQQNFVGIKGATAVRPPFNNTGLY